MTVTSTTRQQVMPIISSNPSRVIAAGKLEQLEGLRGVAAFAVLIHHLQQMFFWDALSAANARLGHVPGTIIAGVFDGNFSVWLFWVMSALVLSLRFHATEDRASANALMTDASIRRYPRLLLPVAASILFAWTLHQAGLMTNDKLAAAMTPQDKGWLASFYQFEPSAIGAAKSAVWSSFFAFKRDATYNPVLWTMEIELYGSFFLFAYLALIGKHTARLAFYAITLLVLDRLWLQWMSAFVMGTVICDAMCNAAAIRARVPDRIASVVNRLIQSRWTAPLAILPMLYLVGLPNYRDSLHLILASLLTAYVVVSLPATRCFSGLIAMFLGKISFGLYLVHFPIMCAAGYPIYTRCVTFLAPVPAALAASLILTVISLVAGWCLWFVADRPAIAFSRYVAGLFGRYQ